jgi:choice-of-anchor C domain-containing protein
MLLENLDLNAARGLKLLGVALLGAVLVIPASANLVTNGTFSTPPGGAFETLGEGSSAIPGWTVGSVGSVDWINNYWQNPAGSYSLDMDGDTPGSISQTGISTIAGHMYDLTFDLSGNPDGGNPLKTLQVSATGGTPESFLYTTGSNTHASMNYLSESYVFTASSNSTTINFQSLDAYPSPYGPVLANVAMGAATTPEPGFYGVLGLGLSGLVLVASRRRYSAAGRN